MSKEKKPKKDKKKKLGESYYEAIVSFKIETAKKDVSEALVEYNKMYDLNRSLKLRNERLSKTKEVNVARTLQQYKTETNDYRSKQSLNKDHVLAEMKELWKWKQSQDREIANMRRDIKKAENDISAAAAELRYWIDFRDKGTHELETKNHLLRKEMADMTENFEIMAEYLRNNIKQSIQSIKDRTDETIRKNNKGVAEKAFQRMEKEVLDMSRDNDWMKETVEDYRKELKIVQDAVTDLEQENVKLMTYLFESNTEELKTVKNIFQTQFLDDDNVEINSFMNVDLNQLNSVRPNSSLISTMKRINDINIESERNRTLAITYEQDENESINTSARALCLVGEKKTVVKVKTPNVEERKAHMFSSNNEEDWPVTQEMLNRALFGN